MGMLLTTPARACMVAGEVQAQKGTEVHRDSDSQAPLCAVPLPGERFFILTFAVVLACLQFRM